VIDLVGFEGPGGRVYDLEWLSGVPAGVRGYFNAQVPDSGRPEVQLEPGGGSYRFRLRATGADELDVRATITQRHRGEALFGTLDVRVFLANGLGIAGDPMKDSKLATVLKTVDAALGMHGIRFAKVTFTTMSDLAFDVLLAPEDTERMIAVNSPEFPDARVLNLYFVNDVGYGFTGDAGAAPGPWSSGVPCAGVVAEYDGADAVTVGVVAAHEIAHYLGWLGKDVLPAAADTAPMLRHALLEPRMPEQTLSAPAMQAQVDAKARAMPPATTWCGKCAQAPVR
jgi:hypothetical protein